MQWIQSKANEQMDNLMLMTLQNTSPSVRDTMYKMFTEIPEYGQIIQVCGFMVHRVLNDDSKNKLLAFIENDDDLKQFVGKYKILILLSDSDKLNLIELFKYYGSTVKLIFGIIKVNFDPNEKLDTFIKQINDGFSNIIGFIKEKKPECIQMANKMNETMKTINITNMIKKASDMTKGGKTSMKSRRRRKSVGGVVVNSSNKKKTELDNYNNCVNYWDDKETCKRRFLCEDYGGISMFNPFSRQAEIRLYNGFKLDDDACAKVNQQLKGRNPENKLLVFPDRKTLTFPPTLGGRKTRRHK